MNTVIITLCPESKQYQQFKYPGGEWQIRLSPETEAAIQHESAVRIVARISNAEDIVKLALLRSAIGLRGGHKGIIAQLVLPYLPYSRADRRFVEGDCAGLETFGALIDSMNFDDVFTLDAHNHKVAQNVISGLVDRSPLFLIERAIVEFARLTGRERNSITVLFPDEGARTRYALPSRYEGNVSHVDLDIYHCSKERDSATGELTGFNVPAIPEQPAIIVDDICDGGGTFIGIARKLVGTRLGLYVTHGIFSRGLDPLLEHFDHIYTTDSYKKVDNKAVTVYDSLEAIKAE